MSKRTQFTLVDVSRGAPMGRSAYGVPADCQPRSIRLFRVNLTEGYDDGGAYWGVNVRGRFLFCARTEDDTYRAFTRAESRAAAARALGIPPMLMRVAY